MPASNAPHRDWLGSAELGCARSCQKSETRMETCLQDGYAVSTHLDRLLRRFVFLFAVVIVSSYSFLSYWEYSKEFYLDPTGWSKLLQGHGSAPQQYRVGVLFVAHFLSALTHGHLAMRHTL